MGGTATPASGASAQSQQQAVESPEIVAARAKSNQVGFERNRAEATYNAVKKEKGEKSPEAQAAKQALQAAQVEVEKAQAELRNALKLPTKSSAPVAKKAAPMRTPAPKSAVAKNEAPESKTPAPEAVSPPKAVIERVLIEHHTLEFIKMPDPKVKQRIDEIIREFKKNPSKPLEYYQKQLNGEQLRTFEAPRGEMAIRRRSAAYLRQVSAAELQKR
jgi:hypothetical protein